MVEKKTKTIIINDKEYTEDQLTDQQKVFINHINDLNRKIESTKFNLSQLNVGKKAFTVMLDESLKEELDSTKE
jgi:hypothetical protein|tara:strand:+ start:305 stop:526 length:222 start_codon:yes stop_codon:yes gene_type:complete